MNRSRCIDCESLSAEPGRIYAEARNDRLAFHQAKLIRDKIAGLLKQLEYISKKI